MTLSLTALSQKSDSTRLIELPKWKADRLLDVYFYDFPASIESLNATRQANDSLKKVISEGEKLIQIRTEERDLKSEEATHVREALESSEKETTLTAKKERRKGRREGIGIMGVLAIVIIVLL